MYRLVLVTSSVAFMSGCEILVPIVILGAPGLPALSSDTDSSESVGNSESLVTSAATNDAAAKPITNFDLSGTYLSEYSGKSLKGIRISEVETFR